MARAPLRIAKGRSITSHRICDDDDIAWLSRTAEIKAVDPDEIFVHINSDARTLERAEHTHLQEQFAMNKRHSPSGFAMLIRRIGPRSPRSLAATAINLTGE